jgi:glycerol-3-phosphate dehydrogenase
MRTPLQDLSASTYDVAIIGGGINGAVTAASLSAAGLKVLVIDKGDFAGFTSQESSNMVWGGIKYLQSLELKLVYKLCVSRARLMKSYPTRIRSIGFFAAIGPNSPADEELTFLGALAYWFIGKFTTPAPRLFNKLQASKYEPSLAGTDASAAVQYFDGLLFDNDARFVWDFIKRAETSGAAVRNYTKLTSASRATDSWSLKLADESTGETTTVQAKAVVNAAGPYADSLNGLMANETDAHLAFSKGIHLVVRKITDDDRVLAFWDEEERLFYVIPMHDRSVIGTTDTRVTQPETEVTVEDRDFVLRQINRSMNLAVPLTKDDIIAERCGVRPLVISTPRQNKKSAEIDWHKLSRKHSIETDRNRKVVTIFGGKLTDCLNVGEEMRAEMQALGFKLKNEPWFGEDHKIGALKVAKLLDAKIKDAEVRARVAEGLWRRHGSQATDIILGWTGSDVAEVFEGLGFTAGELRHIAKTEHVMTARDLLRRRTPIALVRTSSEIDRNQALQGILTEFGLA